MHGGDPGGSEAGVVILWTVQRSRSTSFPFDIPVERERVRGHTEGAGRPNHRSAKHLRQDQLVLAHFQSLQFGFNCSVLLLLLYLHGGRLATLDSRHNWGNSGKSRSR